MAAKFGQKLSMRIGKAAEAKSNRKGISSKEKQLLQSVKREASAVAAGLELIDEAELVLRLRQAAKDECVSKGGQACRTAEVASLVASVQLVASTIDVFLKRFPATAVADSVSVLMTGCSLSQDLAGKFKDQVILRADGPVIDSIRAQESGQAFSAAVLKASVANLLGDDQIQCFARLPDTSQPRDVTEWVGDAHKVLKSVEDWSKEAPR